MRPYCLAGDAGIVLVRDCTPERRTVPAEYIRINEPAGHHLVQKYIFEVFGLSRPRACMHCGSDSCIKSAHAHFAKSVVQPKLSNTRNHRRFTTATSPS